MLRAVLVLAATIAVTAQAAGTRLVIAHRGASGYLPEHTLPSAALAHGLGADYVEPDLVLTKDGVPIVLHDIHLEGTTNVAEVFPEKKRVDGRWYAHDLTLDEVRKLRVRERLDPKTNEPAFPNRFPSELALLAVPTFEEMILLVQGLNKSRGREVGLYPEIKSPAWHKQEGKDIAKTVLEILAAHGYTTKDAKVFVQCFDPRTLKYMRDELKTPLKLVQLIAENDWAESPDVDYKPMLTAAGLKDIAKYADGVGPWLPHVLDKDGKPTPFIRDAHAAGLLVHPYTVRTDALPGFAKSLDELLTQLFVKAGADGAFTDFTDKTLAFLEAHKLRMAAK